MRVSLICFLFVVALVAATNPVPGTGAPYTTPCKVYDVSVCSSKMTTCNETLKCVEYVTLDGYHPFGGPIIRPLLGHHFESMVSIATFLFGLLAFLTTRDIIHSWGNCSTLKRCIDVQLAVMSYFRIIHYLVDPFDSTGVIFLPINKVLWNVVGPALPGAMSCYALTWYSLAKGIDDAPVKAALTKYTIIGIVVGWVSIICMDLSHSWPPFDMDRFITIISACIYGIFLWTIVLCVANAYVFYKLWPKMKQLSAVKSSSGKKSKMEKALITFKRFGWFGPIISIVLGLRYVLTLQGVLTTTTVEAWRANQMFFIFVEFFFGYFIFSLTASAETVRQGGASSFAGTSKASKNAGRNTNASRNTKKSRASATSQLVSVNPNPAAAAPPV